MGGELTNAICSVDSTPAQLKRDGRVGAGNPLTAHRFRQAATPNEVSSIRGGRLAEMVATRRDTGFVGGSLRNRLDSSNASAVAQSEII